MTDYKNHVLLKPGSCGMEEEYHGENEWRSCPVCEGGLSVCAVCGTYEAGLDGPCGPPIIMKIRGLLVEHLGSENAADSWLKSTNMGYPTTPLDAIRAGQGEAVLDDLEGQWGPGPHYA